MFSYKIISGHSNTLIIVNWNCTVIFPKVTVEYKFDCIHVYYNTLTILLFDQIIVKITEPFTCICNCCNCQPFSNCIVGVMVGALAKRADDCVLSPDRVTPDQEIGICCTSANDAALKRKSKDGLARNEDNVSNCGNLSIRGLLFL